MSAPTRSAYTVTTLLAHINELLVRRPEIADYRVMVLDMAPADEDEPWSGLVTTVEIDCYDTAQGVVLALLSDPHQ